MLKQILKKQLDLQFVKRHLISKQAVKRFEIMSVSKVT